MATAQQIIGGDLGNILGYGGATTVPYKAPAHPGLPGGQFKALASQPSQSSAGGVLGASTVAPPVDPYAKFGGKSGYDALTQGYGTLQNNIYSSATNSINNAGTGLHSSILDYLDSLRAGQTKIDNSAIQNELAKKQGTQGVLDMVGQGLRSGGVQLANRNASNSSAGEALARAYSTIGRRELSGVGNKYAQGENTIKQSQVDQDLLAAQGSRHINESKQSFINDLVGQVQSQLGDLNAKMQTSQIPGAVDVEGKKNTIKQQALTALAKYDQELASGQAGIHPADQASNRVSANQLATAGVAPENAFNFTSAGPAQFQNTGPYASQLPIFTFPGRKRP